MKPSKERDHYIVIAPTGKGKVYSVACRKVGSRDRFAVIATCQHEVTADSLVDGLKLLQGEKVDIETNSQHHINDLQKQVSDWRAKYSKLQDEKNKQHVTTQEAQRRVDRLECELREARVKQPTE